MTRHGVLAAYQAGEPVYHAPNPPSRWPFVSSQSLQSLLEYPPRNRLQQQHIPKQGDENLALKAESLPARM